MPLPTYDDAAWPVVGVRMPSGAMSEADFDVHLQRLTGYLQRQEPHALVIDTADFDMSADNRRQLAEHHRRHAAKMRTHLRGAAMIVRSPVQRAMLNVLQVILGSPYPVKAFTDVASARAWAAERLAVDRRVGA